METNLTEHDVAVIGGGVVGSSIAWGLANARLKVAVLDEGDAAYRASRGNFALVWVQGKGLGMPQYSACYFRIRPPVKPITVGELASLPKGDDAVKAVVRI